MRKPYREPTDEERAEWARIALRAYSEATGSDFEEEPDEAVTDLIADLHHLFGGDLMSRAIDRGRGHWEHETTSDNHGREA